MHHKIALFVIFLLIPFVDANALTFTGTNKSMLQGLHAKKNIMPQGCRTCHRGMNLMVNTEESACLRCHGNDSDRQSMVARGALRITGNMTLNNIKAELEKPYSHPTLKVSGAHARLETLPEELPNILRHSECVDCHNVHLVDAGKPFVGIKGKKIISQTVDIEFEYELCYKCHSDSANLPAGSTNKHSEFKEQNPSYHPVEAEGATASVVSLRSPYVERLENKNDISIISCSDCHGSDELGGPKGPHGSNYPGLLSEHYQMEDGWAESEYTYELCYKCHDRASILANESFPYHSRHIKTDNIDLPGISCFSCHDAHGSTTNQHLIRFNEEIVLPNAEGKLAFQAKGVAARSGSCYLSCHGVEHNPKSY